MRFRTFLTIAVAMLLLPGLAFAVPYASQIKVSATTTTVGSGLTIEYFLNQAADSVLIEIMDGATPVASFAGTANQGANSVAWDGSVNNAGGADVGDGQYRVRVTANKNAPAAWTEFVSNSSVGNYIPAENPTLIQTLWDGFSGMEWLISKNPDLDSFGYFLVSTSYSTPRIDGHVVFNPDLSVYDGVDGQTTWANFPATPANNTSVWGNDFDPEDPNYIWVCGQSGANNIMYGRWNDLTLTDVTNGVALIANARDIAVVVEGSNKYAYVALGNSTVYKADVTNNVVVADPAPVNILGLADAGRYSKGVDFDAAGNLYWTTRFNNSSTGAGGAVYRWDAAQVQAAGAGALTEANASWEVTFPTGASNMEGIAIGPDGSVYAAVINEGGLDPTNDGSLRGIYLIGNVSEATNRKQLTLADRIVPFYGTSSFFSGYGLGIAADYAGNLYFADRNQEHVRGFSPGGNTAIAVTAPLSQNIKIETISDVDRNTWSDYR